jgi:hypothetical protein
MKTPLTLSDRAGEKLSQWFTKTAPNPAMTEHAWLIFNESWSPMGRWKEPIILADMADGTITFYRLGKSIDECGFSTVGDVMQLLARGTKGEFVAFCAREIIRTEKQFIG